jgi:alcohol dehydrogenase class IV
MDAAKAVALGATNPGSVWEYRLFGERKLSNKILPIVTMGTTAGTGSHISPVSVLTHPGINSKFAIVDYSLCPVWAIVDPSLTISVPPHTTAATGFDVFAHAFESTLHPNASPFVNICADHALSLVSLYLPRAVQDGNDYEARIAMAEADTLAGICITNAGTTLPHGIAMAIGGHAPHVMHGEALAAVYPAVMEFTWQDAVPQFARLYRILTNSPNVSGNENEEAKLAADTVVALIRRIGLSATVSGLGLDPSIYDAIVHDTFKLPDYQANPKVPTERNVHEILVTELSRESPMP